MQHPSFGEVHAIYATKKSYLLYRTSPDSPKKTLLVEVTEKKTSAHATVLRDVMLSCCRDNLNKAQTVALRNSRVPSYQ